MKVMNFRCFIATVVFVLLNVATVESITIFPHKVFLKRLASLSTVLLLTGSTIASADNTRVVGEITTSGIIFKDTLKITG